MRPYFGLRSYQDNGAHYQGQLGSEATPAEFLNALLAATREMVRVLKPTGSIFVNLGDKYAVVPQKWRTETDSRSWSEANKTRRQITDESQGGIRPKSLMGIPWRYAINCIDDLGLILRAEIIWNKPNGLPESVTDRVRRSHEQWFWFQSGGAVMEADAQSLPICSICGRPVDTSPSGIAGAHELNPGVVDSDLPNHVGAHQRVQLQGGSSPDLETEVSSSGSPVPLPVPVNAAIGVDPSHLVDDGLVTVEDVDAEMGTLSAVVGKGDASLSVDDSSEPREVCSCSHPLILSHQRLLHFTKQPRYYADMDPIREPHKSESGREGRGALGGQKTLRPVGPNSGAYNPSGALPGSVWTVPTQPLQVPPELGIDHFAAFPMELPRRIISAWCPPGGVCVDPFGGTGTTALVAKALGRTGISIDLSSDYCRLATWRCNDPRELAAALQVEKPEPVHPDQMDLFGEAL